MIDYNSIDQTKAKFEYFNGLNVLRNCSDRFTYLL